MSRALVFPAPHSGLDVTQYIAIQILGSNSNLIGLNEEGLCHIVGRFPGGTNQRQQVSRHLSQ